MATPDKQSIDADWLKVALPLYQEAEQLISALRQAILSQEEADQFEAIENMMSRLPTIAKAASQLPTPKSAEAKSAFKSFRQSLKECLDGAKAGQTMFRDLAGGPGERMRRETGFAQRAAAGRINSSKFWLETLTKSAAEQMQLARIYFAPQLQQAPISLVGVILLPLWDQLVEKHALGGSYMQFGRFLTGVTYLYQTGAIIGCSKRDRLDVLGRIMASPGHEAEFWAACRNAAEMRLQEFGREPTSINDLIWSTELAKVGLKYPEFSDFERTKKQFCEKLPCDGRLEGVMKMFVVEGIGFGSLCPELTERMWTKSQEPIEKDQWSILKRFGVDLPEVPAPVSWEQEIQLVDDILAPYVSEYYPDLMVPLNLHQLSQTTLSQTTWENTQTKTYTSGAAAVYCTKCGRKSDPQANYCPDCGTEIRMVR